MVEAVTSGLLEQLARHSSKVKALSLKGSDAIFKLEPPDNLSDATWFSKSTLIRYGLQRLHFFVMLSVIDLSYVSQICLTAILLCKVSEYY